METKLRKSGIDIIGDVGWGTHFCQFFETREDLTGLLVPYFKAGLESNEYCMWVVSDPLSPGDALEAMRAAVPDIDGYIAKGRMEIIPHTDWYLKDGCFDLQRVLNGWVERLEAALDKGYEGLRLTGNTTWLERKDWQDFEEYEATVNGVIGKYRMIAICTYSLALCSASDVLDVVRNHHFALMRRKGGWEVIRSGLKSESDLSMLAAIVESSDDAIITKTLDGVIQSWNSGAERIYGYTAEEIIGKPIFNLVPPDRTAEVREILERVRKGEKVSSYETTRIRKDGRQIQVSITVSPVKDAEGRISGASTIARDITERKETEEALRLAGAYNRSLIEASLDPLVTIGADGKIMDVNEATIKVTGMPWEELIGTDFSDYFTEPEKAREGYEQVFAKGYVTDYPLTIRHRDGKLVDVLYNASVYRDVRGNVLGVFAAARDVTESKRVMREFSETKNFLDNILQSSTKYSIIGKDLNHAILSWNEGALLNYGYTEDEIIGKDSIILHVPEDIESGAVDRLLQTAYEKGLAEGEFQRVRKDGSRFMASVVVTRRNDASGRPIGYLLMSTDITEKKMAEEKLRYASQYARSLIEASLDPLVTISPEGKITDVNEATIKVTGMPRERLIGTDFSDYFTDPEKARAGYQAVFREGAVRDYPLEIRHRDGHTTMVLYNASVYRDEGGDVIGVFAAARDITAQKQAEEALRIASAYNRSLIEASLDPLVTISPGGKITDVNAATELVTGYSRNELIGKDFADYFTEPEKAREGYQQAFREGSVRDYALEIRHRDGHLTPVLYNASVYRDESGAVIGLFAAARDITAQVKAMEMLREQQAAFMEVSVPVVNIWRRIILVPLIGVFDSKRAQLLMETLLSSIEETQAKVAILDISGIPIMDTLVAKNLIRTVSAARLMGTECIITGIRAGISQTMVHLGVDLAGVLTKTTLDEGIRLAFDLTKMKVVPQ